MFSREELKFSFDALEPFIDAQTMEIHSTKHHQGYVNKLNAALENHPELLEKSLEELLTNLNDLPQEVRTAVRNSGGGHHNHTLFFNHLTPTKVEVPGQLMERIESDFGSYENFMQDFATAAASVFGSGWAFLCVDSENKLVIQTQANQDSPLSDGLKPIMGIDVWEHAYYLHYQNRRPEYIQNFFNVIDWNVVLENLNS